MSYMLFNSFLYFQDINFKFFVVLVSNDSFSFKMISGDKEQGMN